MTNGFKDRILHVDLTEGKITVEHPGEMFFRAYPGGSALGCYYILKKAPPSAGPLSPENVLVVAPGVTTGARVSGVSRVNVSALSPLTNAIGEGQAGGSVGPNLKRAGYDAMVITGRAAGPSYLSLEGDQVEIRDATHLWGRDTLEVHETLIAELGGKGLSILQCGPAGEKGVRYACLLADLHDAVGRCGMGAVMGSKNLRALAIRGTGEVAFADPEGLLALSRKAAKALPGAGFPTTLRKHGTPGVVGAQCQGGNLVTHNFTRGYHEDHLKLTGQVFQQDIGAGETTCYGCVVACRKKVKADTPYEVTDRLGGPEFETLGLMGTNLDITDALAVAKANELCNRYGIDTMTMGNLAAYLFESIEEGLIAHPEAGGVRLGFGSALGLHWLIHRVGQRDGIGEVLAGGFQAVIEAFGAATAPYAMEVKGQGLPEHMPQVKPSQALLYCVCPIGPDHQSSEHDWLIAAAGEECRGLGIYGQGDLASTDLDKVRMAAYSQLYYSMMDSLCLCHFCWGPGNLFTFADLEALMKAATGWDYTLWELMKAGERRLNMMKVINCRRGFTRAEDRLPARLGEPLPDGPTKGRRVDFEALKEMQDRYYALMGWDGTTGCPGPGKLMELGLDWLMEPLAPAPRD